VIKFKFI
jgi:hypothetical protein